MPKENELTRSDAIKQVAAQIDGPISLNEFAEQVLTIKPSKAKNPKASIRQVIRYEHEGKTVVFLDSKRLLPMHLAMSGVSVRVPLSRQEVEKGLLYVYPNFQFLLPQNFPFEEIRLVDSVDHSIPAELFTQREKVKTIFGEHTQETRALRLDWWYKKLKVKRQDSLLMTILDWSAGKVRLEPESNRDYRRHTADIEAANHQMADMLFGMLEEAKYENLWGGSAIPTVYARLKDKTKTPADHWLQVLENDTRMYWTGSDIRYAGSHSPIESIVSDLYQNKAAAEPEKLTAEQRNQVYRFKAYFKYHKRIWRRIEIQGGQTMADLDRIMRTAFQHDSMDHLGGFWHLIRRGNSKRFREVDLATVYPYGDEGEGADSPLANLGLEAGERLKYVYDFGDWIEHYLDLEEVAIPETDADYPRIVAQNKPRYQYCPSCQEQGRKTIVTYICIWCSNEKQEEVLMCKDCIFPDHEEHYLDEIVY